MNDPLRSLNKTFHIFPLNLFISCLQVEKKKKKKRRKWSLRKYEREGYHNGNSTV